MNWNQLSDIAQLDAIVEESKKQPLFIFKHSTRCSISTTAKGRLDRVWEDEKDSVKLKPYYLDLIEHRDISNKIADIFGVEHQSPQVLVIKDGKCTYDNSHMGINYGELLAQA